MGARRVDGFRRSADSCARADKKQAQEGGVQNAAHYGPRGPGASVVPDEPSPGTGSTQRTRGSVCKRAHNTFSSRVVRAGAALLLPLTPGATPKMPWLSGPSTI